jgi:hypothetical protein
MSRHLKNVYTAPVPAIDHTGKTVLVLPGEVVHAHPSFGAVVPGRPDAGRDIRERYFSEVPAPETASAHPEFGTPVQVRASAVQQLQEAASRDAIVARDAEAAKKAK